MVDARSWSSRNAHHLALRQRLARRTPFHFILSRSMPGPLSAAGTITIKASAGAEGTDITPPPILITSQTYVRGHAGRSRSIIPNGSTCDPSKDPSCVSDSSGIFVSGSGSDSNAGTKEAPVKTIAAALAKTSSSKNAVYICAGSYAEHVKITTAVNLYGASRALTGPTPRRTSQGYAGRQRLCTRHRECFECDLNS
jgi:hypothetical protein